MPRIHDPAFYRELIAMCGRLGAHPLDVLKVMNAESGVDPAAYNPNGGASGLIQFIPSSLLGVGYTLTPASFRLTTAEFQLPYVERYFQPWKQYGLGNVNRVYQAVFLPGTMAYGSDDSTIIAVKGGNLSNAYVANASVDHGNKGYLTVGDLRYAVEQRCVGPRWEQLQAELAQETATVMPATGIVSVDLRQPVKGLIAAAFVASIGKPVTDLAPDDRDAALKWLQG